VKTIGGRRETGVADEKLLNTKLDNFGRRSFRDMADRDYIAARANFKMELWPQFFWSAQQTIEKYLKCILLFGRVDGRTVKHSLSEGLRLCRENDLIGALPKPIEEFILKLNEIGTDRYFEFAYVIRGSELFHLDRSAWALRQYCDIFSYLYPDPSVRQKIDDRISLREGPEYSPIADGYLEEVFGDRKNPARKALIWRNPFFGKRSRKLVQLRPGVYANNSPLSMYPDQLEELQKYVYLSKQARDLFRVRDSPDRAQIQRSG
jgi:HEPN domain-containing protein